jgi:hypothetical protein
MNLGGEVFGDVQDYGDHADVGRAVMVLWVMVLYGHDLDAWVGTVGGQGSGFTPFSFSTVCVCVFEPFCVCVYACVCICGVYVYIWLVCQYGVYASMVCK